MASFKGNLHSESAPFNNLEIKGSLKGNEFDSVDLLISVEVSIQAAVRVVGCAVSSYLLTRNSFVQVQCVPKTKLQLLNLSPEYISLISSSIHRQPGRWSQDIPSLEGLRSPLFCPVSSDQDNNYRRSPSPLINNEFLHRDVQPPLATIPEESSTERSGSSRDGPLGSGSVAGEEDAVYSTDPATDASPIPDTESFPQGSSSRVVSEGRWSNSGLMEPPGVPIGLEEEMISRLLLQDVADTKRLFISQNLGKRSAEDACLPDVEENEKSMTHRTGPPSDELRNVSSGSSNVESDTAGSSKDLSDNASNYINKNRRKQLQKSSFIPRRAKSTDRPASQSSSTQPQLDDLEVAFHRALDTKVSDLGQLDGGTDDISEEAPRENDDPTLASISGAPDALSEIGFDFEETLNPQSKVASDELLKYDTDEELQTVVDEDIFNPGQPTLEESSRNDLQHTTTSTTDKRGKEPSTIDNSVTELNVETTQKPSTVVSNNSFILSTETNPTSDDEDAGSPKLSTPVRPPQTVNPSTPTSDPHTVVSVTEVEDEDPFKTPRAGSENLPSTRGGVIECNKVCDNLESSTPAKPLKFVTSVLPDKRNSLMGSSERPSQPMQEPRLDLVNGILAISNPLYGNLATYKATITVQVRLQRGYIGDWNRLRVPGLPKMRNGENGWFLFQMPDCLGMEFQTTNFGRHNFIEDYFFAELVQSGDLVVPLRLCLRSFYGTVRDFTVDQEIMTEHVTHKRTQNRTVVYNAMCSLRLYKHCFWAERCRFYLWIDGGPEGDYHCEVDPNNEMLTFLCLPSRGRPIGVSCIEIVCSPKDLAAFCLSWCAECRCEGGLEWLPRIYSAPVLASGHNGLGLREMLSDLSDDFITKTIFDPLDVTKICESSQAASPNKHSAVQTESCQESATQRTYFRRGFISVAMVFTSIFLGLAVLHHMYPESVDFVRNPALFSNSTLGFEFWNRSKTSNYEYHFESVSYTREANVSEEDGKVHKIFNSEDRVESSNPEVEHEINDKDELELRMAASDQKLSWRDRLDYFLGWKGPARRPLRRQISG